MAHDPRDNQRLNAKPAAAATARHVSANDLFAGAREVILEHEGQHYRLRITANGKLILTK